MAEDLFARRVTKLGALADPIRRALYRFVAEQPGAVSRTQAAEGVEIPPHTAKFHLDRLVDEGLLVTEFRRLTGRSGPGAGRTAKLYRRSRKEVTVSIPSRRYDLAGQVLADAVERALDGTPMGQAVVDASDNAARIAVSATSTAAETELGRVAEVLDAFGYEPRVESEPAPSLVPGNCPYDRLAADHRALVCPMNAEFVSGVVRHLGCAGTRVESVEPGVGCCVRVTAPDTSSG
jgi:predicted ArsR family transcriptional regulator